MNTLADFAAKVGTATNYTGPRPAYAQALEPGTQGYPAPPGTSRWGVTGDTFFGAPDTADGIPCGVYSCHMSERHGPHLTRFPIATDNLIEMPDAASHVVIQEFTKFWTLREAFKLRGFLHKRGFLLWGPPGSGKSSTVYILMNRIIHELDGIVVLVENPGIAIECLKLVRKIEPDRPIAAIFEDVDAIANRYGESELLSLLDGESQVDNIVNIATTNYPERLDRRFVDRPSRFDTVCFVGMPNAAARRAYLLSREPSFAEDELELERWVRASDGFSMAHLKEFIIAIKCLGQSLEQVIERMESMRTREAHSENDGLRQKPGFAVRGGR